VSVARSSLGFHIATSGVVAEVGAGVNGFAVGDRVASNRKHAEAVAVPANPCALVPEGVADEDAAFTVLGAIALQAHTPGAAHAG
jgi:NADPH:quinone reductase-like Zn-dependent oxidoreductase